MSIGAVPGVLGAGLVVSNSAALALLSPAGLTPGTQVFNADVSAYFILTTSTAELATDEVVEVNGVTGARWIRSRIVPSGALITVSFLSDEIDFAAAPADYNFTNWPALAGYKLFRSIVTAFWTNIAATSFSAGGTASIGNNSPTYDNIMIASANLPSSNTNANLMLAAGAGGPYYGAANTATVTGAKVPDLATPPKVRVSVSATGTSITQAKGRLLVTGAIVAIPTV